MEDTDNAKILKYNGAIALLTGFFSTYVLFSLIRYLQASSSVPTFSVFCYTKSLTL